MLGRSSSASGSTSGNDSSDPSGFCVTVFGRFHCDFEPKNLLSVPKTADSRHPSSFFPLSSLCSVISFCFPFFHRFDLDIKRAKSTGRLSLRAKSRSDAKSSLRVSQPSYSSMSMRRPSSCTVKSPSNVSAGLLSLIEYSKSSRWPKTVVASPDRGFRFLFVADWSALSLC